MRRKDWKNFNNSVENNNVLLYYDKWEYCKAICKLMMIEDSVAKDICKKYHDKFLEMKKKNIK